MRIEARAVVLVALAAKATSFTFPHKAGSSINNGVELGMQSHYSMQKPAYHPDRQTNMNNFVLDEYSGLPEHEADVLDEEMRMQEEILAEELRQEEEAIAMEEFKAEEEAYQKAAEERAMIREADEMKMKAMADAQAEANRLRQERLAELRANQEAMAAELAAAEEASQGEPKELTAEEKMAYDMKANLSSEDMKRMLGVTGNRRLQFIDNTLDGSIIKRFPLKAPNHPDSRTNNKHFDLDEYNDVSMDEYLAYKEEARLEARRRMGQSQQARAMLQAARVDARLAAKKKGKTYRETIWKVNSNEMNNRVVMKKW